MFSKLNLRVDPASRVESPVNAAMPAPGELAHFSRSQEMMKDVPRNSDGGIEMPSREECSPSVLLS